MNYIHCSLIRSFLIFLLLFRYNIKLKRQHNSWMNYIRTKRYLMRCPTTWTVFIIFLTGLLVVRWTLLNQWNNTILILEFYKFKTPEKNIQNLQGTPHLYGITCMLSRSLLRLEYEAELKDIGYYLYKVIKKKNLQCIWANS